MGADMLESGQTELMYIVAAFQQALLNLSTAAADTRV
jgi:hypothetical protein